jgi:hypothetical protein
MTSSSLVTRAHAIPPRARLCAQAAEGRRRSARAVSDSGDLVSVNANKCVDIKDWNNNRGARLQIWTCAGTANQKWTAR